MSPDVSRGALLFQHWIIPWRTRRGLDRCSCCIEPNLWKVGWWVVGTDKVTSSRNALDGGRAPPLLVSSPLAVCVVPHRIGSIHITNSRGRTTQPLLMSTSNACQPVVKLMVVKRTKALRYLQGDVELVANSMQHWGADTSTLVRSSHATWSRNDVILRAITPKKSLPSTLRG